MLLRSLTIWLALCGSLAAQTFVGPSSAAIGESVAVRVTGVTLPTAPADAAKAVLVAIDSPDESRPASLFGGVFWDFAAGQPQLLLFFRAETGGIYVLSAVAPKEATPKIVSHRMLVVGNTPIPTPIPQPVPVPTPTPTPEPVPPPVVKTGERLLFLVREVSNNTPAMVLAEFALRRGPQAEYLKNKGHQLVILSDDLGVPPNTPAAFKSAVEAAAKTGAPTLVICDSRNPTASGVLASIPFNAGETIIATLSKYGG